MHGIIEIDGGTFQREGHIYRTSSGDFVPSLTQIFRLVGLTDFSMVAPDVLKRAQERGTRCHDLFAAHQLHGEIDPGWIDDEVRGYWEGYLLFRAENHYIPDPAWVEHGIIATLFGMRVAMTPDSCGKLNSFDAVVEFKCTASRQASWGPQTAAQECGRYKSTRAGRAQRIAVQFPGNGKYRIDSHTNHARNVSSFIAATQVVYDRLDSGQDLMAKLAA